MPKLVKCLRKEYWNRRLNFSLLRESKNDRMECLREKTLFFVFIACSIKTSDILPWLFCLFMEKKIQWIIGWISVKFVAFYNSLLSFACLSFHYWLSTLNRKFCFHIMLSFQSDKFLCDFVFSFFGILKRFNPT